MARLRLRWDPTLLTLPLPLQCCQPSLSLHFCCPQWEVSWCSISADTLVPRNRTVVIVTITDSPGIIWQGNPIGMAAISDLC